MPGEALTTDMMTDGMILQSLIEGPTGELQVGPRPVTRWTVPSAAAGAIGRVSCHCCKAHVVRSCKLRMRAGLRPACCGMAGTGALSEGLLFGARLVPRAVPAKRVQRVDEPLADVGRGVELDAGDQQAPNRARGCLVDHPTCMAAAWLRTEGQLPSACRRRALHARMQAWAGQPAAGSMLPLAKTLFCHPPCCRC